MTKRKELKIKDISSYKIWIIIAGLIVAGLSSYFAYRALAAETFHAKHDYNTTVRSQASSKTFIGVGNFKACLNYRWIDRGNLNSGRFHIEMDKDGNGSYESIFANTNYGGVLGGKDDFLTSCGSFSTSRATNKYRVKMGNSGVINLKKITFVRR